MVTKQRLFILIGVGTFVVLTAAAAFWISSQTPKVPRYATEIVYTDRVTNEIRTDTPYTDQSGEGDVATPNLISIAGIDDFLAGQSSTAGDSISQQLTAFVRAHGGAGNNEVAIVNARFEKTADEPPTYKFQMVTRRPEARYNVVLTLQKNDILLPSVEITEAE